MCRPVLLVCDPKQPRSSLPFPSSCSGCGCTAPAPAPQQLKVLYVQRPHLGGLQESCHVPGGSKRSSGRAHPPLARAGCFLSTSVTGPLVPR